MTPNELGELLDAVRAEMRLLEEGRARAETGQLMLGEALAKLVGLESGIVLDMAAGLEAGVSGRMAIEYNETGPSMLGVVDAAAMIGFLQGVTFAVALDRVRSRGWFGEA